MNGDYAYAPVDSGSSDEFDAVCGIIDGDAALLNGVNTFGCGVLINTYTVEGVSAGVGILMAAHTLPTAHQTTGFHQLDPDGIDSRVARFRRRSNGVVATPGTASTYAQYTLRDVYVGPAGSDLAIAYVGGVQPSVGADGASPDHIVAIDVANPTIVVNDTLLWAGWGKDGVTYNTGTQPGDVRIVGDSKGVEGEVQSLAPAWVRAKMGSGDPETNVINNVFDSGGGVFKRASGTLQCVAIITTVRSAQRVNGVKYHEFGTQLGIYETPPTQEDVPLPGGAFEVDVHGDMTSDSPTTDHEANGGHTGGATSAQFVDPGKGADVFGKFAFSSTLVIPEDARLEALAIGVVPQAISTPETSFNVRLRQLRRAFTADMNYNTFNGADNWEVAGAGGTTDDVYSDTDTTIAIAAALPLNERVEWAHANLVTMGERARDAGIPLRVIADVPLFATTPDMPSTIGVYCGHVTEFLAVRPYTRASWTRATVVVQADGMTAHVTIPRKDYAAPITDNETGVVEITVTRNGSPVVLSEVSLANLEPAAGADVIEFDITLDAPMLRNESATASLVGGRFTDDSAIDSPELDAIAVTNNSEAAAVNGSLRLLALGVL